jgi:carboxymethylenebutenolidase
MIEKDVLIPTANGVMPAFAACPDEPRSHPPVIFYMDAPGIREELRKMARQIARRGYFCLLPDLYYRLGLIRLQMVGRDESTMNVFRAAMAHLTNARAADDTAAMISWLDSQEQARLGPIGCIGYCMSGRYVVTAAGRYPGRVAAVASLYGTGIATAEADSPHLLLPRAAAEMYFAFGERDSVIPLETVETVRAALNAASTKFELDVFPDASHGFAFAERATYDHRATEESAAKVFALFNRRLTEK